MNRIAFHTLGCKVNQYETEAMRQQFEAAGYVVVPFKQTADIYMINSCTVTERADQECRRLIRRALRQNSDALVYLTGCYAQLRSEEIAKISSIRGVIGNAERAKIVDYIRSETIQAGNSPSRPIIAVSDINRQKSYEPYRLDRFSGQTRAFLKIQDGCDLSCSFCAITQARGPNRSRPMADLIQEAERLSKNGYKEIILTGVRIESYGKDIKKVYTLSNVLQNLSQLKDLERIRLSSVSPLALTDELINLIAGQPKICNHIHLSLQSGDDKILREMRRPYQRQDVVDRIRRVAEAIPSVGIGSDMMVGFPGETAKNFDQSYGLIERLPIVYLHVFPYSPRPNTAAADMPNQIPEETKAKQSRILRELGKQKKEQFYKQFLGRTLSVIVENRYDKSGRLTGLSDNYIRVSFPGSENRMNQLIYVRLTKFQQEGMVGEEVF